MNTNQSAGWVRGFIIELTSLFDYSLGFCHFCGGKAVLGSNLLSMLLFLELHDRCTAEEWENSGGHGQSSSTLLQARMSCSGHEEQ